MRARVPKHYPVTPFHTVSLGRWVNEGKRKGRGVVAPALGENGCLLPYLSLKLALMSEPSWVAMVTL